MQRTTITIDDELSSELDAYMLSIGATSRSEAIRDLVRRGLSARPAHPGDARCFGVVSYVIDQAVRNLAARVPQGRLERHDQTVATVSIPVDHTNSIDVTVMRGNVEDVSSYAEKLFLERGVMHGAVSLIPITEDTHSHSHHDGVTETHTHLKVRSSF